MNEKQEDAPEAHDLEGRYANYFKIGYNAFEFLLDFGQLYNGDERAQLHTRIITSPAYAKNLLKLLQDSIAQHEETFGAISNKDEAIRNKANGQKDELIS